MLDALVPFLGPEFEREPEYPAMSIQGVAADAIGKIGMAVRRRGGTCPPHIGEAPIRSDHPGASSWIVCAIGAVGYREGADVLRGALSSSDWNRRTAAAWALGELGDPAAIEPLTHALDVEEDRSAKRMIADALQRFS